MRTISLYGTLSSAYNATKYRDRQYKPIAKRRYIFKCYFSLSFISICNIIVKLFINYNSGYRFCLRLLLDLGSNTWMAFGTTIVEVIKKISSRKITSVMETMLKFVSIRNRCLVPYLIHLINYSY